MKCLIGIFICAGVLFLNMEKLSAAPQNVEDISRSTFQKINDYRVKNNLPPLVWDEKMAAVAREHSRLMATKQIGFGHGGAGERFEVLRKMTPDLNEYGENVAFNYERPDLVDATVRNWIKSPDHRDNIVDHFTHTGVGIFRNKEGYIYFTQIFGHFEKDTPEKNEDSPNLKKVIFNPPPPSKR